MAHVLRIPLTADQRKWIDEFSKGQAERWVYKLLWHQFRKWRDDVITLETDSVRQPLPRAPPGRPPEGVDIRDWYDDQEARPPEFAYHRARDLVTGGLEDDSDLPEGSVWFEVRVADTIWPFVVRGLAFYNLWQKTLNDHAKPGQERQVVYATIGEWAEEMVAKRLVTERIAADRAFKTQEEEDLYPGIGEEMAPKAPPGPAREPGPRGIAGTGIDPHHPNRRRPWDR